MANLEEERIKVRHLQATKEQLEHKTQEVAMLKTKNQMDLLDFKIRVVGDSTYDDWDEMKRMQALIND